MSRDLLPASPSASNVIITTLPEVKSVERAHGRFFKLSETVLGTYLGHDFDLAEARQTLAEARQAREMLPVVTRPAVADEIATQLTLLAACFPNKEDKHIFAQILAEDVASLNPSVYALQIACRRLRHKSTFRPVIAEVLTEMKQAQRDARFVFRSLDDDDIKKVEKHLDEFERDLPHLKQEYAAREKRREQRERSRLHRQLQRMTASPGDYSDYDLLRRGVTRDELERHYEEKVKDLGLTPPASFTRVRRGT